jgi:hypothetical protein
MEYYRGRGSVRYTLRDDKTCRAILATVHEKLADINFDGESCGELSTNLANACVDLVLKGQVF